MVISDQKVKQAIKFTLKY